MSAWNGGAGEWAPQLNEGICEDTANAAQCSELSEYSDDTCWDQ